MNITLNYTEKFLLRWLAAADSSALGECSGRALDVLVRLELAEIDDQRVSLTEKGWGLMTLEKLEPYNGTN